MRRCFWIDNKDCPYLTNLIDRSDYAVEKVKDKPMLEHFDVKDICQNCLMATYITLRSKQ